MNSDTKSLFLSSVPFYCTNAETSRYSIAPKLKDKSCSLRCRSKNLRSLVTAAIIMSLLHDNVPAGNGVSSWISLKVHGLTPSRSHLPVGEWSRQAHAQEECKVAQPVAKQFMKSWKAAHSLLPSAALEAECVCRAGSNIPILLYFRHLFATRYPLIRPFFALTLPTSSFAGCTTENELLDVCSGAAFPLKERVNSVTLPPAEAHVRELREQQSIALGKETCWTRA